MRDERYSPADIASYGAQRQPAIAARARRHQRTTLVGSMIAALGLIAAVVALLAYPDIEGSFQGRDWVVALVAGTAVMLVLCVWQHLSWRRASQVWQGKRQGDIAAMVAVSWGLHLASYAVAAGSVAVGAIALVQVGWYATTAVFVVIALIALLVGHVLAAVQYVRAEGPPGAPPTYLRVSSGP